MSVCVVRVVCAAYRARGARGARACLVRVCVCVRVVHVVCTAHGAHGARARVCICGARDERSAPRVVRTRVCVCI